MLLLIIIILFVLFWGDPDLYDLAYDALKRAVEK